MFGFWHDFLYDSYTFQTNVFAALFLFLMFSIGVLLWRSK